MEMSNVGGCLGFEVTVVEFLKSIGGVGINEETKYVPYLSKFYPCPLTLTGCSESNAKIVDQARSQVQAEHKGLPCKGG